VATHFQYFPEIVETVPRPSRKRWHFARNCGQHYYYYQYHEHYAKVGNRDHQDCQLIEDIQDDKPCDLGRRRLARGEDKVEATKVEGKEDEGDQAQQREKILAQSQAAKKEKQLLHQYQVTY
jgi:hypothetical protein